VRNIITTLISQVASWGLNFAVILFLPHYAGAKGLGEITLAGSFASVFGLISSLGSATVLMRDIPRDIPSAGRLILASLIIRVPLAALSIVIGLAAALAMGFGHEMTILVGIAMSGTVAGVLSDTLGSAVRGLEKFSIANIGMVIDKVISSILIIAVCVMHGALWLIIAAPIFSTLAASAYMLRAIKTSNIVWSMPDLGALRSLVRAGLPFISVGIFMAVYAKSDALFLSKLSTTESIGWYGLAFRISGTAMALPAIVCSAMLPALSTLYVENKALFADGTSRLINLMILCSVPFAAIMIFCPEPLIAILSHRTASFLPAVNVVRVYGAAILLWFVSQAAFTSIIACDQQKAAAVAMGAAAVLSLPITAGSIFLTQHFWQNGAVGAAISDFLIEIFLFAGYCYVLPKGIVNFSMVTTTAGCFAAVMPLVAAVCFLPIKYALVMIVPCMLLYGILSLQFKCLHAKDLELFRRLLGGKFGFSKT
jgi:O-antigen/teichoic acid export membrane protein